MLVIQSKIVKTKETHLEASSTYDSEMRVCREFGHFKVASNKYSNIIKKCDYVLIVKIHKRNGNP
jgi:hypothetical protein